MSDQEKEAKKQWQKLLRRSYFINKNGELIYTNPYYIKHNIYLHCNGTLKLDKRHDFGISL